MSTIGNWVDNARDKDRLRFRQAVHTILLAIAESEILSEQMIMKGGMLMALQHHSPRFTADIDFSTNQSPTKEIIEAELDRSLQLAVAQLDYGVDCRLHSCKRFPPDKLSKFGSFKIKIGYADKNTNQHRRLLKKASTHVVEIDYSLNESISNVGELLIEENVSIQVYAVEDVIAEKFRALLQQTHGRRAKQETRSRRQDVFDIYFLLKRYDLSNHQKTLILNSLHQKVEAREITLTIDSLDDKEVKRKAHATYPTLADELDSSQALPDFDTAYETINAFYKGLFDNELS